MAIETKLYLMRIFLFQVGLLEFLLGIFRLGFIDVVLSRALLRGFVTAVAFVIMVYVPVLIGFDNVQMLLFQGTTSPDVWSGEIDA